MAGRFAAVLTPWSATGGIQDTTKVAALGAGASSSEIVLGNNVTFVVWGTQQINVRYGPAGLGAAAATDFGIPANTMVITDTGEEFKSIRVFNNGASAADVYVMRLVPR